MKRIAIILIILTFFVSCASTYENEDQHYLGIKGAMVKDRYSVAVLEIMKFKEKYPNSRYLCELLPIQIAWRKDKGLDISENEKEFNEKCNSN